MIWRWMALFFASDSKIYLSKMSNTSKVSNFFSPVFVPYLCWTRIFKVTCLFWFQSDTPTFLTWLLWNVWNSPRSCIITPLVFGFKYYHLRQWNLHVHQPLVFCSYVMCPWWEIFSSVYHAHWNITCIFYAVFPDISSLHYSHTESLNLECYIHYCFPFHEFGLFFNLEYQLC